MTITNLIRNQGMTKYKLAKESNVPYSTLNDICKGKTNLAKCSAETVYRLAKALHVSMEDLLTDSMETRCSFDLFKSNVCHKLKNSGDIDFLIELLKSDDIRKLYDRQWYRESLYLLAMADYICRINGVDVCEDYNDLRKQKLKAPIYPASVLTLCAVSKSDLPKQQAMNEAIPEFRRFNIIESEIRNVV